MCSPEECIVIETGYWIDKEKGIFKRKEFMPYDVVDIIRLLRNNKGIFKTAYRYNKINQDEAELYGDFYLDFDSKIYEEAKEDAIRALSYLKIIFNINTEKECYIYYSGNKGFHIIVPTIVFNIKPNAKLNVIFKSIARKINTFLKNDSLDLRIYDSKRLFRIENSIHEKSNLYKIQLTKNELTNLSEEEVKHLAKKPRILKEEKKSINYKAADSFKYFVEDYEKILSEYENKTNKYEGKQMKYTPPCITGILENGAEDGKRNNTIAILATYYKLNGKSSEETLKIINNWNEEKNMPPTSSYEINRSVISIYNTDKIFGCTAIQDLCLCDDKYVCKYKKNK